MATKDLTSADRLALFETLLDEGWSFSQIQQTHRVDYKTLKKHFPDRCWTLKQGAELGAAARHASLKLRNMNRA